MPGFDLFLDATAQAELVRRGDLSPAELVEETIQAIERVNPTLNAIVIPLFDKARSEARTADGPYRGVPYVLKDLTIESKGDLSTAGIKGLKQAGHRAPADSWFTERMREAGFVLIGRTNTPEMGIYDTTEPEAWGPCANPWDPDRASGASSGGSAAAVGSGMVPVAHGNDGAGSVRMPASLCGVVGLKPTRGRIASGPEIVESDQVAGVAHEGLMTRSVRDMAAVLDIVSGRCPGSGYSAPTPERSFAAALRAHPGRLRIGVLAHDPRGEVSVAPECVTATRNTAAALAELGHHVADDFPAALRNGGLPLDFLPVVAVAILRELERFGRRIGRPLTEDDVEPYTWAVASAGKNVTGVQYAAGVDSLRARARDIETWWEQGWDLLITPTTAAAKPPLLGRPKATAPDELAAIGALFSGCPVRIPPHEGGRREARGALLDDDSARLLPFTASFNVTGQPAITLPIHHSSDGYPIGIQLVAGYGREDVLLRVSSQLEALFPWSARRPPIHA